MIGDDGFGYLQGRKWPDRVTDERDVRAGRRRQISIVRRVTVLFAYGAALLALGSCLNHWGLERVCGGQLRDADVGWPVRQV